MPLPKYILTLLIYITFQVHVSDIDVFARTAKLKVQPATSCIALLLFREMLAWAMKKTSLNLTLMCVYLT